MFIWPYLSYATKKSFMVGGGGWWKVTLVSALSELDNSRSSIVFLIVLHCFHCLKIHTSAHLQTLMLLLKQLWHFIFIILCWYDLSECLKTLNFSRCTGSTWPLARATSRWPAMFPLSDETNQWKEQHFFYFSSHLYIFHIFDIYNI